MKNTILIVFTLLVLVVFRFLYVHIQPETQWKVQSIDTMKYSRDRARDNISQQEIDKQVKNIADTGANYVAIGTPYDSEFIPVMKQWISAARKYHLHVWFRGNFAGWEGWFNYPRIDRQTHLEKTAQFIKNNPDLFEDGDIFTSCTECENGSPIPYGNAQAVADYRMFLINEYQTTKTAFQSIHKNVASNYYSMNGDLAKAVMDKETTKALDGIVVIDHYVKDPQKLADDIHTLEIQSGGKVMLGEFGAPVPDIHGNMTDNEQMLWVDKVLKNLSYDPQVVGVNYWVNRDGTTALWTDNNEPKPAVSVIKRYFTPSPSYSNILLTFFKKYNIIP